MVKNFKLVLKTTFKKVSLKYQPNQKVSFIVLGHFLPQNGPMTTIINGKKFKLVLKTIYKKVFLKYHINPTFPSLC